MGLQVDPKELKKRQFFLEGNIPKAVLSVCLPMALFQLINELFRVFDLVITSQINPESVSAVSFFNQLNNSIVSVGTGLSIGAGILIAGLYGAGEYERLKTTVNTTFFMAGAAALVLVAGLILGARPILRLANTPAQLVEIGLNYYRITALNLFFTFFNNVYIAIEKARGNGSKIMRINFAMALTKFSFSAFFVLVLHQGIVMIGVATLLSNLVVTAIGLYNLRNCSATSFLRNWDSILEKKRANLRSISEPARLRQPPPQKHRSGTRKRAGSKHTGGATNSRPSRAFCPLVG